MRADEGGHRLGEEREEKSKKDKGKETWEEEKGGEGEAASEILRGRGYATFSRVYIYLWVYAYCFYQIFQGLCLFEGVCLLETLE